MSWDWGWALDLAKDGGKALVGGVVGAMWQGLRDRKKNKAVQDKTAKSQAKLRDFITERDRTYQERAAALKNAPEGPGKRLVEEGMFNCAQDLTAAYRAVGEEAESLRWGVIAKDLASFAKHQPVIDQTKEAAQKLDGLVQEQTTLYKHFSGEWRKSRGAMNPNKRMWAEKAKIAVETVADAYRKLGNEAEAMRWDATAKNCVP